ncbi:bifunctional nicotinamide mononucleotide adenylyltransferase/ADP-ribose pyrophosphatase [compost metagenome]
MRVTCSVGGLIIKKNKVLLVKITYGANKDYWMLPGGLVEEGETFEEAAIREVKEESGEIIADGSEISEVKYRPLADVIVDSKVVGLNTRNYTFIYKCSTKLRFIQGNKPSIMMFTLYHSITITYVTLMGS